MNSLIRDRLGERIDLLRRFMKSRGVDAALAMAHDGYNWETCYHLSGFRGSSCALVVFRDDAILVTDRRYLEQASRQTDLSVVDQGVTPMMEVLEKEISSRSGVWVLGFQARRVTCDAFDGLKGLGRELVDISAEFSILRRRKDPDEAKIIEEAASIASSAFIDTLSIFSNGMSERELAARLEYEMRLKGAEGVGVGRTS